MWGLAPKRRQAAGHKQPSLEPRERAPEMSSVDNYLRQHSRPRPRADGPIPRVHDELVPQCKYVQPIHFQLPCLNSLLLSTSLPNAKGMTRKERNMDVGEYRNSPAMDHTVDNEHSAFNIYGPGPGS